MHIHVQGRSNSRCSAGFHSRLRPDPLEHDGQNSAFPRASSEPHLFSPASLVLGSLLRNNEKSRVALRYYS